MSTMLVMILYFSHDKYYCSERAKMVTFVANALIFESKQ